jgi:E1A-binding protein p400
MRMRDICFSLQVHEAAFADEARRRRRAARIAGQVAKFWVKVDKLVVFKHKSRLDAMRRAATDKHLTFLVGQTERYTELLANTAVSATAEVIPAAAAAETECSPSSSSGLLTENSALGVLSAGIEKSGKRRRLDSSGAAAASHSEDGATVRSEIEHLSASVPSADTGETTSSGDSDSEEFEAASDALEDHDDEATLEAEEALANIERTAKRQRLAASTATSTDLALNVGDDGAEADELAALEEEANLSIEELRHRYGVGDMADDSGASAADSDSEISSDDASDDTDSSSSSASDGGSVNKLSSEGAKVTKTILPVASDERRAANSIHLPFLLRNGDLLRPYQRDGLDWLVSMHDRRLNGILADESTWFIVRVCVCVWCARSDGK